MPPPGGTTTGPVQPVTIVGPDRLIDGNGRIWTRGADGAWTPAGGGTDYSAILPPDVIPYPGVDGYYYNPRTGEIGYVQPDPFGISPKYVSLSETERKRFLEGLGGTVDGGGGGGGGGSAISDDPRYWDVQYKQLYIDLLNAGWDANSARMQVLQAERAGYRNAANELAATSGNIAAQAAQSAANPRDAVSELMYRNAISDRGQGATPFGTESGPEFQQYGSALANKFQELFGGVGGDLARARYFLSSPPPEEFSTPIGIPQMRKGGRVSNLGALILRLNGGAPPATAEDGVNMNIMEPAMVMGMQSGRVYATMSESDPEQLIVKPLPSTKERKKKDADHMKGIQSMMQGAQMMQGGGTINAIPDLSQLYEQMRRIFSSKGVTEPYAGVLPDVRLLANAPWNALDPLEKLYAYAGYSSLGIDPSVLDWTLEKFTPQPIRRDIPRVVF